MLLVEPHIEWGRKAETESALDAVEMVETDAQVGQYAVHLTNAVVVHPVLQVAEVAMNEGPPRIVYRIAEGVGVLVKGVETTVRTEALHDAAAMTTTSEGDIHVDAILAYLQPV